MSEATLLWSFNFKIHLTTPSLRSRFWVLELVILKKFWNLAHFFTSRPGLEWGSTFALLVAQSRAILHKTAGPPRHAGELPVCSPLGGWFPHPSMTLLLPSLQKPGAVHPASA